MAKFSIPEKNESDLEKKALEIINKGGGVAKKTVTKTAPVFKSFTIKILESEIEEINMIRQNMPKIGRGKRLDISLHDFIVAAVQEKIEREK